MNNFVISILILIICLYESSGFKFYSKNINQYQRKLDNRSEWALECYIAKSLDENIHHRHHHRQQRISLVRVYDKLLNSHPLPTKIFSSAVVGALGDILLQLTLFSLQSEPYLIDKRRVIIFCVVSAVYIAPTIHYWFDWLNNFPMSNKLGKSGKAIIMMLLDQTLGAFLVTFGFFYAFELVCACT